MEDVEPVVEQLPRTTPRAPGLQATLLAPLI